MVNLTAERLREVLSYDPETGIFTWRVRTAIRLRVGDVAGRATRAGYRQISIDLRKHLAHRLVWLYVHGTWPTGEIDHINGDPTDNRLANLRDVSASVNQLNRHRLMPNKLGFPGVFRKKGRFGARIKVDGRTRYLGMFDTPAEAAAAYRGARFTVLEELQAGRAA